MAGDDYTVCSEFHLPFGQPATDFSAGLFISLSLAALDFIVWSHQQALSPAEV